MSMQPDRGAISAARTRNLGVGARLRSRSARISPRYAGNGSIAQSSGSSLPDPGLITARYQLEQAALGHQAVFTIRHMWDNDIEPEPFAAIWPKFYPQLRHVVLAHYRASAASAARFYRASAYANGKGLPRVQVSQPNEGKLDHVMDAVANGTFYHQLHKLRLESKDASMVARNSVSGAAARFALGAGRDTVIRTALDDPDATGWERLTEPDACSYCVQQAARGPFSGAMSDFHPHDYCNCVAVPIFRGNKPINKDLKTQWQDVTQGRTGKQARAAWEEYVGGSNGEDTTDRDSRGSSAGQGPGSGTPQPQRRRSKIPNSQHSLPQEGNPRGRTRQG